MIRKIKELAFSNERSLEERRFLLAGVIGCVAVLGVLISVLTTQQGLAFAAALAVCFVLFYITIRWTIRSKKFNVGGSVIVLVSNMFLLPAGYMLGGGIESGAPLWLVIGVVFVFVLFRGTLFWIYLIITGISFGISLFLASTNQEWVVHLQEGYDAHFDSYLAIMMVSILCGLLFKFQSMVLERELRRSEDQRDEIEKLNDMQNNFFASMSHEIRTPINTIIGLNEMTMREKQLPEEVQENTLNIQNASKLLLSLINDILDMSKIQSGKMEIIETEYDTSRMLSEITNMHWNRAMEKGLNFDIQVGENIPPMLFGDETRIKQVIINLLTNAIKYTDEGSVTMRFGGEKTGGGQFLLRVDIEDTGIGIRKENIQYLFDAFQRVDEEESKHVEGTGLGLSIAKQLVDMMGGTISVNSIYTKGSTFRVEIPQEIVNSGAMAFQKPGVLENEKPQYQQTFEAPEAKVLVVDDNDMNRIVCRKLLRATQVQVDLAESGYECLEKTSEKHYDVIFMDHEMPQMDGVETLHKLRQQSDSMCRDTPVIALTANAGSDREAYYIEQGFSAYLSKPIQSRQLENLLMACLPEDLVEKTYIEAEEEAIHIYDTTVQKVPFVVTTDTICDLPEEILDEYEIGVMPYYIETRQGRFRDIHEIDSENLQQFLLTNDESVHSTPAPIEEYEQFFGNALSEARVVLHLSSGRNVTSAYDNALEAARSFDNVHVIDTGQISSGLGMVAIRAVELFRNGMRVEEVLDELRSYQQNLKLNYLVPSLGISKTKYRARVLPKILMNVFNLEPVFTTKNGKLRIKGFLTGYFRSTQDQFIRDVLANKNNIKTDRLFVIFSGCDPDKRRHIIEQIQKYEKFDRIIINKASATTFCNCGPNAFGLTYEVMGG